MECQEGTFPAGKRYFLMRYKKHIGQNKVSKEAIPCAGTLCLVSMRFTRQMGCDEVPPQGTSPYAHNAEGSKTIPETTNGYLLCFFLFSLF